MNKEKINLKKIIKYRISYSGMKETDIIYQKLIINKLDLLNQDELKLLSELFNEISDADIFSMLTNKIIKVEKFNNLIIKILDE
jgi:succinate dehydrogenase flavin-adding protein (antitoxin of CptAB toxin-antitoxin module)